MSALPSKAEVAIGPLTKSEPVRVQAHFLAAGTNCAGFSLIMNTIPGTSAGLRGQLTMGLI